MGTPTPATLLQLMWLASPALPVGGFSYSETLEAAVESGHVNNEGQAADWLLAQLRGQAEQMGRSLLDWLRNGEHATDPRIATLAALAPAPLWPTAFAVAAVLAGAGARDALLAFAWGWAENMAQAAMKAVPLGQA